MPTVDSSRTGRTRYLPQSVIATAAVTLIPLVALWGLRSAGVIASPWVCIPLAVVISLAVSAVGSAYWKRRRPASELLFSELMLWSWLHHRHSERTIADASKLLKDVHLSSERREHLLRQIANSIEAQDPYTVGHSHRVARHAAMVARKLGLSAEETRKVRAAAAIHDVGKLRIAPEILHKPDRLSDAEYELIKHHSTDGAELVSALGDAELTAIVRHHHERLDGSGYPSGLVGAAIPLGARIVAVADTFDAITSARPYRPARAHKQALEILREEAGRQLDGRVVEAFIACYAGKRAVVAWATLNSVPQNTVARIGSGARSTSQARISPQSALSSTTTVAVVAAAALAAPIVSQHRRHAPARPAASVFAAAPVLHPTTVKGARTARKPAPPAQTSPFSPVVSAPVPAPPTPAVRKQLAAASAPLVHPGHPPDQTPSTPAPQPVPGTPTPTTFPTTPAPPPPATTSPTTPIPPPPTSAAPPPTTTTTTTTTTSSPLSTTTSTTATTSTTSTTPSTTTTTTTSTTGDRCKNGGYLALGYPHQGDCESDRHRHHGSHDR